MTAMRVDTDVYQEIAQRLNRVVDIVQTTKNTLCTQRRYVVRYTSNSAELMGNLQHLINKLSDKHAKTTQLRFAVLRAADRFAKCERKLSGKDGAADDKNNAAINAKFLSSTITVGGKKIRVDVFERYYPSDKKQKMRDAEIQSELRSLLMSSGFNEAAWKKATAKGRKEMLEKILKRMNEIYGTNVSTKINFFKDDWSDGLLTNGYFSSASNSISMNTFNMTKGNFEKVMTTLMHEMRHAYQHAAVDNPRDFTVSKETYKAWKDNFNDYKTSSRDGYDAYYKQAVEADARGFSEKVLTGSTYTAYKVTEKIKEVMGKLFWTPILRPFSFW